MITAQIEKLADTLEEMKPYFPVHWEEFGLYKDRQPLDPQYDQYLLREQQGQVALATLREDGKLIGYFPVFINPGLHYKTTLTATMDIVYLPEQYRGNKYGYMLFDCMRTELKRRGVKMWWVGSKNHKPIQHFFEQFGFELAETYHCMWLGDE